MNLILKYHISLLVIKLILGIQNYPRVMLFSTISVKSSVVGCILSQYFAAEYFLRKKRVSVLLIQASFQINTRSSLAEIEPELF